MAKSEKIKVEMSLKNIIAESREVAQALNELADNLERIEKKYAESEDVPDINNGNIYVCSCGYGWDKSKVVRHHFCPNCGAKVAEGSDKE